VTASRRPKRWAQRGQIREREPPRAGERLDGPWDRELRVEQVAGDGLGMPALERTRELGQIAGDAAIAVGSALDALDVEIGRHR
jgi:hypothetical protein